MYRPCRADSVGAAKAFLSANADVDQMRHRSIISDGEDGDDAMTDLRISCVSP